jgi:signal transduction histidine kinase
MTDGRNFFGDVLPMRQWINELARRHDLEMERPRITAELNRRYALQKKNLHWLMGLATLLAAGIISTILIERRIYRRQLSRIQERIAADLHDELGANFHTIGLLSQLIEKNAAPVAEKINPFLQRIREIIQRSGIAVRHIAHMQEADGLYSGLETDLRRVAERIVAELKHDITFEGTEHLARLRPQTRVDLFLFYKECLVNICRHSGATELSTRLSASPQALRLTVCDNGTGIKGAATTGTPSSLQRRAHLMGAEISVETPASGGTCIALRLRNRLWRLRKVSNGRCRAAGTDPGSGQEISDDS